MMQRARIRKRFFSLPFAISLPSNRSNAKILREFLPQPIRLQKIEDKLLTQQLKGDIRIIFMLDLHFFRQRQAAEIIRFHCNLPQSAFDPRSRIRHFLTKGHL